MKATLARMRRETRKRIEELEKTRRAKPLFTEAEKRLYEKICGRKLPIL